MNNFQNLKTSQMVEDNRDRLEQLLDNPHPDVDYL